MWIVIKGGPIDGYEFVGPFDSNADAEEYMDTIVDDATWAIKLIDPTNEEQDAA